MPFDFKTLMTVSPNPYVLLDRSLHIVWLNDAYAQVTMRQRDELIGRQMFEAFPSDPASESHRLLKGSLEKVVRTAEPDELALIRYDIATADGGMDVRYWSATHTPLLDDQGRTEFVLQHTVDVTELHGLRTLRDEMSVVERASRVQSRNLDLSEERQQLKQWFEQAPGFIAVVSGPEHRFTVANRAYRQLVGGREVVGLAVAQALPEVIDQGFVTLLDEVRRGGQPFIGRQVKVALGHGDELEERYVDFVYQPILDEDGQPAGVFVQGHDVTDQVHAQDVQRLLINELNHRVKNTLAIVQALASQSFRQVDGFEPARRTFEARLNALSAAHSLLTSGNWEVAALDQTIRSSVEATVGLSIDRVEIDGPSVELGPQAAVSLAMIVHELATNALKHGSLSVADGRVEVRWTVDPIDDEERRLTIEWIERGGPPVKPPEQRGFGTRLIGRGLSSERGSGARMEFTPDGFEYRVSMRLGEA